MSPGSSYAAAPHPVEPFGRGEPRPVGPNPDLVVLSRGKADDGVVAAGDRVAAAEGEARETPTSADESGTAAGLASDGATAVRIPQRQTGFPAAAEKIPAKGLVRRRSVSPWQTM